MSAVVSAREPAKEARVIETAKSAGWESLPASLFRLARERRGLAAYRWFDHRNRKRARRWGAVAEDVKAAAAGLVAFGLAKGERVALIADTSYAWVQADLAILSAGGVTVGLYPNLPAHELAALVDHSESSLLIVPDLASWGRLREAAPIPSLRTVITLAGGVSPPGHPEAPTQTRGDGPEIRAWAEIIARGGVAQPEPLRARMAGLAPGDLATIVYTSGTSGRARGAMLTHDNLVFTAGSARASVSTQLGEETFLFLPLAHVFARLCVYFSILVGVTTTFGRGSDALARDLRAAAPHWFVTVPRLLERVRNGVESRRRSRRSLQRRVTEWCFLAARRRSEALLQGLAQTKRRRAAAWLADLLVFRRIRALFGPRLRFCISGSAPLDPEVARYLHMAGVLVLEGLGMTENTAFSHVNRLDDFSFGVVGRPGPGVKQRLEPDGELLIHGRNVMRGYWRDPEETSLALGADGWLRTGDQAEFDRDGRLRLVDRKKDLLITSGGRNIAPSMLELRLTSSPFVMQAVVIGDRRSFLTALLTLEEAAIRDWARDAGLRLGPDFLHRDARVRDLIEGELALLNHDLAEYMRIRRFTLVAEFTLEEGLLTATQKKRRRMIEALYRDEIERMYAR